MAVFTPLDRDECTGVLAGYALGELVSLQGIVGGIENTNFFVTTTRGEFVLTIFERLTFEQLPYYLELMRHLARRGLPVPEPHENRDGALISIVKGKPVAVVDRMPGASIKAATAAHCAAVGDFLARMHVAGRDFPLFQPNLRGLGWWKEVLPALQPCVGEELFQTLAEEVIFQDTFERSGDFEKLPGGPNHADLFRDNVLFTGTPDTPAIGGVIDFYFAGNALWLYDVAVTVNDWCVELDDGAIVEQRAAALLRAYHAVRPLTELERQHWRTVQRAAALRFWISRLYDLHRPRTAQLLRPHDPARFERTLMRRRTDPALPWI